MIDFCGGYCSPVLTFDGAAVGNGAAGPVACALGELLVADFDGDEHTDAIPFAQ